MPQAIEFVESLVGCAPAIPRCNPAGLDGADPSPLRLLGLVRRQGSSGGPLPSLTIDLVPRFKSDIEHIQRVRNIPVPSICCESFIAQASFILYKGACASWI
jgi:hypothetical protein